MYYNQLHLVNPQKPMTTVPFSFRIDSDTKAQLELEARALDRSASYVATKAIKAYLRASQRKRAAIDQAVEAAEKRVFVSEKTVTTWVDSWGTENELPKPAPDIFLKNP